MATVQVQVCDLCGSRDNVATMTVVWKYGELGPWELDLCERCYGNRLGDLAQQGRRAKISNVRPQSRVRKTEISEAAL